MSKQAKPTPRPWAYAIDSCAECRKNGEVEYKVSVPQGCHGQFVVEADAKLIVSAVNSHDAALNLARAVYEAEKRRFVKRRLHAYANLPPEVADWTQILALARKFLKLTDGKEER